MGSFYWRPPNMPAAPLCHPELVEGSQPLAEHEIPRQARDDNSRRLPRLVGMPISPLAERAQNHAEVLPRGSVQAEECSRFSRRAFDASESPATIGAAGGGVEGVSPNGSLALAGAAASGGLPSKAVGRRLPRGVFIPRGGGGPPVAGDNPPRSRRLARRL